MKQLTPKNTITQQEALDEFLVHIREAFPEREPTRGGYVKISQGGVGSPCVYVEVVNSFHVSASLQVRLEVDFAQSRELRKGLVYTVQCQVSWPSSIRSVSNAQACVTLYQKMTSLGALIESIAADLPPIVEWETEPASP